ncbi:hypothetical protein BZB76_0030 [Actinomadura pelletieri DSM 43383]|uniref:Phosphotransferase family enzyme n=1 Tax=Actinomadura pelletieri DSM 43383 TaxID=1120940 RepID=A0A495QWY2_9ACTN|nr:aminoglycoside phosphotransferase [Actinomadura pelletieri]RKS78613.1 hypothetical protein BZB76_0030 [Actinomadura pelletieri DSM 43383]
MNLYDLSQTPHDDVLTVLESRLGVVLNRSEAHYSALNGTAGFPTSTGTWVRLSWYQPEKLNAQALTGFEAALALDGVPRPVWQAAASWYDQGRKVVWRAEEMTRTSDPVISPQAAIPSDPGLPDAWWSGLQTACKMLAGHVTDRVCMTQTHLSGRIADAYGEGIDTTITDWATVHGDLGWANLCGPELAIIDWESWGQGPAALDAVSLWAASMRVSDLADKVTEVFADVLSTRTGQLTRLMMCANVARAFKRTGRKGPLTDPMAEAAGKLLDQLR